MSVSHVNICLPSRNNDVFNRTNIYIFSHAMSNSNYFVFIWGINANETTNQQSPT